MNINLEVKSQELSMSWGNVSTKQNLNQIVDDTAFKYVKELNMLGLTNIKVILM